MSTARLPQVVTLHDEETRYLQFDFSDFPEVNAGATLSSPAMSTVTGLTFGSPAVTSTATDGVTAGKGVVVQVTASTAGTYTIYCTVTLSSGGTASVRAKIIVD
jgi:plastocyanin